MTPKKVNLDQAPANDPSNPADQESVSPAVGAETEAILDETAKIAETEKADDVDDSQTWSSHVLFVHKTALTFFDATQPLHELPEDSRRILALSALLHDQPFNLRKKDPLKAYRKSISNRLGDELPPAVEAQLLPILLLQRGKLRRKDIIKLELSPAQQRSILSLAAILSLATGLDTSNSQGTEIEHISAGHQVVWVAVRGPQAMQDAAAAKHSARLWENIGYPKIKLAETSAVLGLFAPQFTVGEKAGIEPADTIAEAGRKILRYHFAAMLSNEEGTRAGENIEFLHDMRVATRRMRAGFDVFGDAFERQTFNKHLKGLRAVGRALGSVRDLDVFMEKAMTYLNRLPEEKRSELDPLLQAWQLQRETAREKLLAFLDSEEYQTFKARFGAFLMTPGVGVRPIPNDLVQPTLVRELAPVMIYQRLAEVRAYQDVIPNAPVEQLHALRIEFKKARYSVEYFREVLGPESEPVIDEFKRIQDHLGDLNDAQVAIQLVQEFIDSHKSTVDENGNPVDVDLTGLEAYRSYKEIELARLIATFPEAWERFSRPEIKSKLALAVSTL